MNYMCLNNGNNNGKHGNTWKHYSGNQAWITHLVR